MTAIRQAAVAGQFYPGSESELSAAVAHYLGDTDKGDGRVPKALIAPHAGFVYSGPVAATAYARLGPARDTIRRVVLLGPCHRVAVRGLALSGADAFATPLGEVPLDKEAMDAVAGMARVEVFEATHELEHSLEVHLPFLQAVLDDFRLVPIVVGEATPGEVAEVLEALWGGRETLIVVSSDLSHYLDYDSARRIDRQTCQAIEALDAAAIPDHGACGRFPVGGLLETAKRRGMTVETLDLRNSGDTAGSKDRVVGYGSWAFMEKPPESAAKSPEQNRQKGTATVTWNRSITRKAQPEGEQPSAAPATPPPIPSEAALATERNNEDSFADATQALLDRHGATLVLIAAASIDHGLVHGEPLPVNAADHAAELQTPGASFVTLKRDNALRGCIGTSEARRPLIEDIADNAFRAAFKDPRFPPLTADYRDGLTLSISVLSRQSPMAFAGQDEFLEQLRPGTDGLVIEDGKHRALFLPSVWAQLAEPSDFVSRLKVKAGLGADHWSDAFKAWRFVTREVSSADVADPGAIWNMPA